MPRGGRRGLRKARCPGSHDSHHLTSPVSAPQRRPGRRPPPRSHPRRAQQPRPPQPLSSFGPAPAAVLVRDANGTPSLTTAPGAASGHFNLLLFPPPAQAPPPRSSLAAEEVPDRCARPSRAPCTIWTGPLGQRRRQP